MSGAINAHKSPFELAGGETYGLSWIQTMNVHNAFLWAHFKKGGIFLALKGLHIPAQGNALGNTLQ